MGEDDYPDRDYSDREYSDKEKKRVEREIKRVREMDEDFDITGEEADIEVDDDFMRQREKELDLIKYVLENKKHLIKEDFERAETEDGESEPAVDFGWISSDRTAEDVVDEDIETDSNDTN
jgi:hypothetical protein